MFSFFSSILNSPMNEGGNIKNNTIKNSIKNVLDNKKILYSEINTGINLNINNKYNVVIPYDIIKKNHIQIKRLLKDKDGNCVECIYIYKLKDDKLEFLNRIKILDLKNIRSDNDNTRIDENFIKILEKIINEINNDYNKNGNIESSEKSEKSSESNESVTKTDKLDYEFLKNKSKIKKIYNTTITESE